jgi:PAS domain S-box-containing protein
MTFGQRLRELRIARGITQRELAEKTGISFAYVSKLETDTMQPPRENIILALSSVLGVNDADMDDLFGLAKKMPPDLRRQISTEMIRVLRSLNDGNNMRILDGIVILDTDLSVIYETPSAAKILGYEPGEFIGKDTLAVIHPDDMSKTAHGLTTLLRTPGDIAYAQLRVRHKDGTWHLIEAVANNLTSHPSVNGVVIDYRDITGRSVEEGTWVEHKTLAMAKEYLLTEREHKVLALLVDGQSNTRIAEQLIVSPSTVRFHVSSIFTKLGVSNRAEAVAFALRHHIVA